MEVYLAKEFHLTLKEVWVLKWRRLRILIESGFTWQEVGASGGEYEDWQRKLDAAVGRTPGEDRQTMSLDQYLLTRGEGDG